MIKAMNEYYIYLKVEPYLAQWLCNAFGNPIVLPKDTPEIRLIKRFLDKTPSDKKPDMKLDSNVQVVIPWSKEKDPRVYNYLSPRAKMMLVESFETIFLNNLWTELGDIQNINCSLTNVIYSWLEKHEISEEHWETIRQKYYRIRKRFQEKGIKLS